MAPERPLPGKPRWALPPGRRYALSVALFCGLIPAVPLWIAFYEPAEPLWNGLLAVLLLGLVGLSFAGIRYLQKNSIGVGEARVREFKPNISRQTD